VDKENILFQPSTQCQNLAKIIRGTTIIIRGHGSHGENIYIINEGKLPLKHTLNIIIKPLEWQD
jgi:hypothetical protein